MPLEHALDQAQQWMESCARLLDGLSFETSHRDRIAVSLQHLCIEHHSAIHTLVNHRVHGSAFALIRPQFEAYVRGAWFHFCSNEGHVASFIAGSDPPKIDSLISDLEKLGAYDAGNLSLMKKEVWKNMNDFTHGGIVQVKARVTRDEIRSRYRDEDLIGLLGSSSTFALLAGVVIASVGHLDELAENLKQEFHRAYPQTA
jgi:hypothetical protein